MSLFTVVQDPISAANDMNHDLELISQWAHDWRMTFNPYPQKRAHIFKEKDYNQSSKYLFQQHSSCESQGT